MQPDELRYRVNFDDLTPLYPETPIKMEHETNENESSEATTEQDAEDGNANGRTAGDNMGFWGKIKKIIK